ncbi:uncharacterized protein EV154DRAFT_553773 [Mucor mucedo]|uniref:uncharacterized protein n=1 Tax=Mucor mucedo TaxID=29922 RepID=UPI00221E76D0|nr:uncharacterized protein EV154DRAFT_553773 [Mucor mucedo]KAI7888555.1 hypothetical protein EV154DRAFT_553773 [Mucor mucedo]
MEAYFGGYKNQLVCYQIKFWGVIFEAFFYNDDYMLHWGDTVSKPCKRNNLRFKADLRIVVMSKDEDVVDGRTAEVAKKASPKKLFMDKLKSVLGTKCHVNNFLSSVPFIPAKDIKNVVFPIVQIMGFDVHIYSLQLVNRGLYLLQDLDSFSCPTNYTSLKHGLAKVINGLSCIETMYGTYQMDHEDDMARILSGTSKNKRTPISSWTTDIIWNDQENEDFEDSESDEINDA